MCRAVAGYVVRSFLMFKSGTLIDAETDYAYTAKELVLTNGEGNMKLGLEMLALAREWNMTDAQRAVQKAIINSKMVDPYTLDQSKSSLPLFFFQTQILTFKQSVALLSARNQPCY